MPAVDLWARQQTGLESPLVDGEQVTPSDSTDLTKVCRALHIGTGGDVTVITKGGTTLPLGNIARDRKSTRLNSSHSDRSRMPSSA